MSTLKVPLFNFADQKTLLSVEKVALSSKVKELEQLGIVPVTTRKRLREVTQQLDSFPTA